jgi:hypothetical protein
MSEPIDEKLTDLLSIIAPLPQHLKLRAALCEDLIKQERYLASMSVATDLAVVPSLVQRYNDQQTPGFETEDEEREFLDEVFDGSANIAWGYQRRIIFDYYYDTLESIDLQGHLSARTDFLPNLQVNHSMICSKRLYEALLDSISLDYRMKLCFTATGGNPQVSYQNQKKSYN